MDTSQSVDRRQWQDCVLVCVSYDLHLSSSCQLWHWQRDTNERELCDRTLMRMKGTCQGPGGLFDLCACVSVHTHTQHVWSWVQRFGNSITSPPIHISLPPPHVFSLLLGFVAKLDGIWSTVQLNKDAFMWNHSLWFRPVATSAVRPRLSVSVCVCLFGIQCAISDLISLCSPA